MKFTIEIAGGNVIEVAVCIFRDLCFGEEEKEDLEKKLSWLGIRTKAVNDTKIDVEKLEDISRLLSGRS